MSSDEGAEWAAVSAPTLAQVKQLGPALSLGKLGFYDVVLHFWIRIFGQTLTAMRMLSAVLGVLGVGLLLLVIHELFGGMAAIAELRRHDDAWVVALSAGACG